MEVEGNGGPTIEKSLRWLRATLKELGIPEEKNEFVYENRKPSCLMERYPG
jgi:hypothetical protein